MFLTPLQSRFLSKRVFTPATRRGSSRRWGKGCWRHDFFLKQHRWTGWGKCLPSCKPVTSKWTSGTQSVPKWAATMCLLSRGTPVLGHEVHSRLPKYPGEFGSSSSPGKAHCLHRNESFTVSSLELMFSQFRGPFLQITLPTLGWSLFWWFRIFARKGVMRLEPRPSSWGL